jgi:repressor of nif and glnA expression
MIVGSNCYNGNIQNWGPGGSYKGEGRSFRYPLRMIDEEGSLRKRKYQPADMFTDEELMSGHYAFGANRLHIMRALDQVISRLEEKYGLDLGPDI